MLSFLSFSRALRGLQGLGGRDFESPGVARFPRQKAVSHPSPNPQRAVADSRLSAVHPYKNWKQYPHLNSNSELSAPPYQTKFIHELEPWLDRGVCDFVLDIRDARLPFTSENKRLTGMIRHIPRVVVFNRCDLADPTYERKLTDFYTRHNVPVVFTAAPVGHNIRALLDTIRSLPVFDRFDRPIVGLALGMANVGKTSVVDKLRLYGRGNKEAEALFNLRNAVNRTKPMRSHFRILSTPGTTRMMSACVVSRDPVIVLHDTPGVMYPNLSVEEEISMKMVVCGLTRFGQKRRGVVPEHAASYLLQHIMNNPIARSRLLAALALEESEVSTKAPTAYHIFRRLHTLHQFGRKHGGLDMRDVEGTVGRSAGLFILKLFAAGRLGPLSLDTLPYDLESLPTDLVPNAAFKPTGWEARQSIAFHTDSILSGSASNGTANPPLRPSSTAVGSDGLPLPRSARTYGTWLNRDVSVDGAHLSMPYRGKYFSPRVPLSPEVSARASGVAGRAFPWQRNGSDAHAAVARAPERSRAVSAGVPSRIVSKRVENARHFAFHPGEDKYQFH